MLLFVAFALPGRGADSTGFSAVLNVQLDKKSFLENEPVSGAIRFKLAAPASWPVREKPTVVTYGPIVTIEADSNLSAVPTETYFDPQIANPVKIGHQYEIRFKIAGAAGFLTNVQRSTRPISVFTLGQHHLSVRITSPERKSLWSSPPGGLTADWTGTFVSEREAFSVSAANCIHLKRPELLAAIEQSQDSDKESFAKFFHARGHILTPDLLPIITKSEGTAKGRLAEFYQSLGGPLKELTFFEHPQGKVILDDHTAAPFFLKLAVNENVRFVYSGSALHNVNGIGHNYVANADKSDHVLRTPGQAGLYRVVCDIHSSTWGWVLIAPEPHASGIAPPARKTQ